MTRSIMDESLYKACVANDIWLQSWTKAGEELATCRDALPAHPKTAKAAFRRARQLIENDSCAKSAKQALNVCIDAWNETMVQGVESIVSTTVQLMEAQRQAGRQVVLVMAPIFTSERLADGFFRRVHAIDELFGPDSFKVYLGDEEIDRIIRLNVIDTRHISIAGQMTNDKFAAALASVVMHADLVYCQSAYHVLPKVLEPFKGKLFYDFHGVAPEEVEMNGDLQLVPILSERERFGAERADTIVTVTDAMRAHILAKYPNCHAEFITIPIFDEPVLQACDKALPDRPADVSTKPVIVYAGGIQTWQMIPQMCDAIEAMGNDCSYKIFTPDIEGFWNIWGNRVRPDDLLVATRTPAQVVEEYASCDFGFVLREDSTVNRVACPTKLVEYCACGIVPILLSKAIGDFDDMGMQSVTLEEFQAATLPTKQRAEMVRRNKLLAQELADVYRNGITRLTELLG